jgi:hypothetical protein
VEEAGGCLPAKFFLIVIVSVGIRLSTIEIDLNNFTKTHQVILFFLPLSDGKLYELRCRAVGANVVQMDKKFFILYLLKVNLINDKYLATERKIRKSSFSSLCNSILHQTIELIKESNIEEHFQILYSD